MDDIEVVADSEGEELKFEPHKAPGKDISLIDTDTSVASGQIQPSSIITATASFVASLEALLHGNVEENTTGKPRPRPRPKFRDKEKGRKARTDAFTTFTDTTTQHKDDMDFPNILSIADRAKMRQRVAKRPSSPSYETAHYTHPFDDEDELSHSYHVPDGDEEFNDTLCKSQPKHKLQTEKDLYPGKVIYEPNPTLLPQLPPEPYIPETRLEPQSLPAQTRPKPRPIKRSNKVKSSLIAAGNQHQPTPQLFIPIATSPLPPSDPPHLLSSVHHHDTANVDHREINISLPPVESLPVPTSSPSSLFSAAVGDEGEDAHIADVAGHIKDAPGLEGDLLLMDPMNKPNQNAHITADIDTNRTSPDLDADPRFIEPPSTFFKDPSSSDHPSPPKPKEKRRKQREEQVEVIDLCTAPPKCTDVQIVDFKEINKKGKKTKGQEKSGVHVPELGKTKGKGKRKANDDDDFKVCGDDNDDDDYKDSAKRKKVKTKTKGKKTERKLSTNPKKSVEAIVEVPTLRNAGKQETVEVPSAKDEIEQLLAGTIADEEAHLSTPNEDYGPLGLASRSIKELDPGLPVSSVPDSEGEEMQDLFDMEMAAEKSKGTPITSTPASRTVKKRRRLVVYDDEEEETHDGEEDGEGAANSKKAKTTGRPVQSQRKRNVKTKGVVICNDRANHEQTITAKDSTGRKSHEKRKASRVLSDTEGEASAVDESLKENIRPHNSGMSSSASKPTSSSHAKISSPDASDEVKNADANTDTKIVNPQPMYTSLTPRYAITPKARSTPMSELIRRVNSIPLSPLTSPPRPYSKAKDINKSTPVRPSQGVLAYSPYLKASRSFLSRIAPLHPNRRTPPPPPPPPPPRKKSKKELELEERWEEELIDSVGGSAAWSCLSEDERKEMKRHKWAVERGEIGD